LKSFTNVSVGIPVLAIYRQQNLQSAITKNRQISEGEVSVKISSAQTSRVSDTSALPDCSVAWMQFGVFHCDPFAQYTGHFLRKPRFIFVSAHSRLSLVGFISSSLTGF